MPPLIPPASNAGIPLSPAPGNLPVLTDITSAMNEPPIVNFEQEVDLRLASLQANIIANNNQNFNNLSAQFDRLRDELPVKVANSSRGTSGCLRHPHTGAILVAPNPRTQDQLVMFTGK
jgi:hypothetical protein